MVTDGWLLGIDICTFTLNEDLRTSGRMLVCKARGDVQVTISRIGAFDERMSSSAAAVLHHGDCLTVKLAKVADPSGNRRSVCAAFTYLEWVDMQPRPRESMPRDIQRPSRTHRR